MKKVDKGSVDYDLDRYGRKIKKYIVTKMTRDHGRHVAVWEEVLDFVAEKDLDNHNKK